MTLSANFPVQFYFHERNASDKHIKKPKNRAEDKKTRPMLKTKTENEQAYHLFEISKEIFDQLDETMTEGDAGNIMYEGRHLYMAVDDRCGPPYTIVFDDDYEKLCPWARVIKSGRIWSDELTDAAVELFQSEENNRPQRRRKREERNKQE